MDSAARIELEAMAHVKPIDDATAQGNTEIQGFYNNATIFVTGGSGFLGKQLIEKLFRSCDIKKVFVLIRPKKGKSTQERLQVMLSDPVFGPVRRMKPDFEERISAVEGDVAELRLGISYEDWLTVTEEVDIIFHVAATVRFDEKLRLATLTNVRGTREALRLGKDCKKLRSYIHVSTAYCHATSTRTSRELLEQFYPSPVPPETMLNLVETVDNDRLEAITSSLIKDWPNTYTFTKAIAEALVEREVDNLPIAVVRPSIVISAYREPLPGWMDMSCVYGPCGICVGVALGVLRVFLVDNTRTLSLVPVDFVTNATVAAGWEASIRGNADLKIYNISTSNCGVTFRHISVPMRSNKIRDGLATTKSIWYLYLFEIKNRFLYWCLSWLLHYIPGYFVDGIIKIFRIKKPKGLKSFVHIYEKFDKMAKVFEFFVTNDWNFDDANLQNLWQRMSPLERCIYNFDLKSIDWDHNTCMLCLGLRKYILKDALENTHLGARKQKWLQLANYGVLFVYLFVFWQIVSLLCWGFRFFF